MLEVIEKAFPEIIHSEKGQKLINDIVPTWNKPVTKDSFEKNLELSKQALQL
jgi:malate dehydrogenase (quinone)